MSTTCSQSAGQTCAAFDESAWRVICKTAAAQATKDCGLSYDLYIERFSSAIDIQVGRLPDDPRAQALLIAQEWDYATPTERQATQDWNAANGCCSHGITMGCCPLGCGS
jgi:hypothetical protein